MSTLSVYLVHYLAKSLQLLSPLIAGYKIRYLPRQNLLALKC